MAHRDIVERMGDRVGVVERFGKGEPAHLQILRSLPIACHLQRKRRAHVCTNARIVPAEGNAQMAVPG